MEINMYKRIVSAYQDKIRLSEKQRNLSRKIMRSCDYGFKGS